MTDVPGMYKPEWKVDKMSFHFQKQPPKVFYKKKVFLKISATILIETQRRCFLVKFVKLLRTIIVKNICERLLCISYDLHKYLIHV